MTPSVSVQDLAGFLHPSGSVERQILVLRFYADASGKQDGPFFLIAGYLAPERTWAVFESEWGKALRAAGVSHFHATDFFNARGEFKGWDLNSAKHRKFAKRFTAIAETHSGLGLAMGLRPADFRKHLEPILAKTRTPHRRFTPLMFCATKLLSDLIDVPGRRASREPIAALFEAEEGVGEAIDYFNFMKRAREPWTKAYVSFATGDKSFLPLQGADLLAHESWRQMKEHLNPTGRVIRKSMQRLVQRKRVRLEIITEASILASIPGIQRFLAESPEGLPIYGPSAADVSSSPSAPPTSAPE